MDYKEFINSTQISHILERLERGAHLYFGKWELFMSYMGTFWVRREMTQDEMDIEEFEEQGWHQVAYEKLEEALDKIGYVIQSQITLFDLGKK